MHIWMGLGFDSNEAFPFLPVVSLGILPACWQVICSIPLGRNGHPVVGSLLLEMELQVWTVWSEIFIRFRKEK